MAATSCKRYGQPLVRRVFKAYNLDALSLVEFWMKQSQRRGASILFKMLSNKSIFLRPCSYMSTVNQIENAAASLWFVGYSKRISDALLL
jgi:hypothetical protein